MFFKDVPGHSGIKSRLLRSVNESRIPHAQLFHGPEGCGKMALALAYARYISCTSRQKEDACGICPSCVKYSKLAHPDLHFAFPSVASGEGVPADGFVNTWRNALLENPYLNINQWFEKIGMENKQGIIPVKESQEIMRKLSMKPYESDYKILLMFLPERMHNTAANKLLKLIEEPPPGTVFLLVSEAPDDVLPTIQSRTQAVKIPKLQDEDISQALISLYQTDPATAASTARMANGNFNLALSAIQSDDSLRNNFDMFVKLMRQCYAKNIQGLVEWTDEMQARGRERQKLFLSYALRMIRENFMKNLGNVQLSYMTSFEQEFSEKFARFIHKGNVVQLYEELNLTHYHISANGNGKIVLFDTALKIVRLLHI